MAHHPGLPAARNLSSPRQGDVTTPHGLAGKVALITGSDSGIGQATAAAFADEGADVVITYLHDAEGADSTRKDVEAAGRKAIVVQLDISDETQVPRPSIEPSKLSDRSTSS